MRIIGRNLIANKSNKIESHNPLDKIRTTKAGDMFANFISKEIDVIKTDSVYCNINLLNLESGNKVLTYIDDRVSVDMSDLSAKELTKGKFLPPNLKYDIEFFFINKDKNIPIAFYNKENNILIVSTFVVENMSLTYFDYFVDHLLYYNINGKIKETITTIDSNKITVGIDGELEPIDKVSLYPYSCRDLSEDELGCVKLSVEAEDPIGIDNGYGQIEIRPGYGSPDDVVESVKSLMEEIDKSKYHISTIGDRYPLGCHVHFGFGMPIKPSAELLFLLDYFIGLKMMKLSGESRGHFQQTSAFRIKAHGFEYRSMPSAIMETPTILKYVLMICLNVVKKYNNGDTFILNRESEIASIDEYKQINIDKLIVKALDSFITEYKEYTYEKNTIAAWHNETRGE
jgi:hypothetical protein